MARKTIVELTDDLDGKKAAETVSFALDGRPMEIDLSSANAAKLRKALEPYIEAGRRVRGGARAATATATAAGSHLRGDAGHPRVGPRQRLPGVRPGPDQRRGHRGVQQRAGRLAPGRVAPASSRRAGAGTLDSFQKSGDRLGACRRAVGSRAAAARGRAAGHPSAGRGADRGLRPSRTPTPTRSSAPSASDLGEVSHQAVYDVLRALTDGRPGAADRAGRLGGPLRVAGRRQPPPRRLPVVRRRSPTSTAPSATPPA